MNPYILKLFDTFYMPTMEELEKSYKPRKKLTEYDYLVNFLETGSNVKARLRHRADPPPAEDKPNIPNRE